MGFAYKQEGIAASIFLAFYIIYTAIAVIVVFKRGIFSLYTSLLSFGLIRMGAQISGIGFAKEGISNWHWLVAYLVLGAEGYFILILSTFHLIARIQVDTTGYSWLDNVITEGLKKPELPRPKRSIWSMNPTYTQVFHYYLIASNVMIIVGGTMLTSITADELAENVGRVRTSKGLRSSGQAVFLSLTLLIVALLAHMFLKERVRHPSLYISILVCPFLIVRGVYGVLSIFIDKMNYFLIANYTSSGGLKSYFLVTEYCMSTTMEFVASLLLMVNYFIETKQRRMKQEESLLTKDSFE